MPITLEEAKVGMPDHVAAGVIDTFQRSSILMDMLPFDDAATPVQGGGSTLVYNYVQIKTSSKAGPRKINEEYVPNEAKKEAKTAKCVPLGQAYEIDRVIANTSGAPGEIAFQTEQAAIATVSEFSNAVINGDGEAAEGATFDGLKKLLAGTDNEFVSAVDVSTSAKLDSNAQALLDEVDTLVSAIPGCNVLLMNHALRLKLRSAARRAGFYNREVNGFGANVEYYGNITMIDAGKHVNELGQEVDIIPTEGGKTALYGAAVALDGLHGISPDGQSIVNVYLPDLQAPGAVKRGEVEIVAGIALKQSRKAGVLKDIKIAAAG